MKKINEIFTCSSLITRDSWSVVNLASFASACSFSILARSISFIGFFSFPVKIIERNDKLKKCPKSWLLFECNNFTLKSHVPWIKHCLSDCKLSNLSFDSLLILWSIWKILYVIFSPDKWNNLTKLCQAKFDG